LAGEEYGRLPLPTHLSPRRSTGGSGSGESGTRRRKRVPRWIAWTAGSLVIVLLVVAGVGFAYYEKLNGNVRRVDALPKAVTHPAKVKDGGENILLVGSDSRTGATPAELALANTTDDGGGVNTDTIIVLHLAPDDGPVTMISFPRDSFVPIPGHGTFKINSAYADGEAAHKGGGPALLAQTIENLTGLHLDHYIEVNFFQFINISDAIGGVRVCLTAPAKDSYSGIDLPAGTSTIEGKQALAFVRQRHGLPEGDIDRIKRQQRFATALVQKAETIHNPLTINALLEQATKSLTVDKGESGLDLLKLGNRLRAVKPANIKFVTVPVKNSNASERNSLGQNVSYVQLDLPALATFFANIKAERDPYAVPVATSTPSTSTGTSAIAPSEVSVEVLNGRRTTGAAGLARQELTSYGYTVTSIADAPVTATTTIRYGSGEAGAASSVAKAVPGATLVEDDSLGSTVELILGQDGQRVTDPANAPSPTTTITATPTTSATSTTTTSTAEATAADDNCGV
jgi:LCP family protein required for cell wall assembly